MEKSLLKINILSLKRMLSSQFNTVCFANARAKYSQVQEDNLIIESLIAGEPQMIHMLLAATQIKPSHDLTVGEIEEYIIELILRCRSTCLHCGGTGHTDKHCITRTLFSEFANGIAGKAGVSAMSRSIDAYTQETRERE